MSGEANAGSGNGSGSGAGGGQAGSASGSLAAGQGSAAGAPVAGAGGSNPGAGSGAASDWTSGLAEDKRGFVQNKGWKGADDLLTSYQNLEKLVGVPDQIVKLPQKDDDTAGWDGVYNKLGRPAKAEDYSIEAPKEGGSPEFVKWAKETFHSAGLSEKQAQALYGKWNELTKTTQAQTAEQARAQSVEQSNTLKKEWGAAYDQNVAQGKAAAASLGIDGPTIEKLQSAMGYAGVMKFMQNLGSKVGEHKFEGSGSGGKFGIMTPESARAELQMKSKDVGFMKRYSQGDSQAMADMQKLQQAMSPGEKAL